MAPKSKEDTSMDSKGRTKPRGRPQRSWKAFVAKAGEKHQTPSFVKRSKEKPKAAARRRSFCARMKGMKKKLTSEKTRNDPNSRINKALRKWDC